MAILNFQKPDRVFMVNSDDNQGQFEFRPLEPGYGLTVGNALRRVLLSSLEGFAISSVRIDGVEHEFSTIKGVVEDVTEIILNLKQVRFKKQVEDVENESVQVSVAGQDQLKAGDIGKYISGFQVLNPDLVICNMDSKVKIDMTLSIIKGRGFVTAEEQNIEEAPLGTIATDSIFTPIKNVKFEVENFRVEQKTDYEKLIFDVITDGSIDAKDALTEAAKILIHHFMLFSDERITLEDEETSSENQYDEESLKMRQLLQSKLTEMDLSVRALNCLKAAEVDTLGDLVTFNKSDLMKFRNFGKKSLTELDELVAVKGLNFGMDTAKYKLDKNRVMRHGKKFNHLGRKAAHRKAMLANMACSLIEHKRINTTVAKAKALKQYVEPLITKSKVDSTHSRRVVFSYVKQKETIKELFGAVATKVASRPGGYTRIIKTGNRLGDNAEMCMIELVDFNEVYTNGKEVKKTKTRRRKKSTATVEETPAVEDAQVVEETTEKAEDNSSDAKSKDA